jgi:hypothetical protein
VEDFCSTSAAAWNAALNLPRPESTTK